MPPPAVALPARAALTLLLALGAAMLAWWREVR